MILDDALRGYGMRLVLTMLVMVSLVGILGWRTWHLQVETLKEHQTKISEQYFRRIHIPPVRGRILGSDGVPFADNQPRFKVYFHMHELRSAYYQLKRKERMGFEVFVQRQIEVVEAIIGRLSKLTPEWQGENEHASRDRLLIDLELRIKRIARLEERSKSRYDKRAYKKRRLRAEALLQIGTSQDLSRWLTCEKVRDHLWRYRALPLELFSNLAEDERDRLFEALPIQPGVEISCSNKRIYPLRTVGAHLIGYLKRRPPPSAEEREAAAKDPAAFEEAQIKTFYYFPEFRGGAGLERLYDSKLSGKGGAKVVRLSNTMFIYDELTDRADLAETGDDVVLTIDSRAQTIAQGLLEGRSGALVCLDVHTGAVVAMVSSPSYDLNEKSKKYTEWNEDAEKPLNNRALLADKAPGSIIKPLVALSILENGVAQYNTLHNCEGVIEVGKGHFMHCHNRSGHGPLNVLQALEVSCNPYFIRMGMALGIERLEPLYAAAGFGQDSGLEFKLPRKWHVGVCPGPKMNGSWTLGDTANVSIGQGKFAISPLQAAVFTAAIANGGMVMRPHVIKEIRTADGDVVPGSRTKPFVRGMLPAKRETIKIIQAGMYKVVYGSHASAPICRGLPIKVAGKTGTAEVGPRYNRYCNTWFTCFAPFNDPKYAVTVFVERGKSGGRTSAPIAAKFLERYLEVMKGSNEDEDDF